MPRRIRKFWPLALLALTGCGTIGNLQDKDKVYGGTQLDGSEAWRAGKELLHHSEGADYKVNEDTAILIFACIDMPLSALADTATLPITVSKTVLHWVKGDKPADGPPPPGTGTVTVPINGQPMGEPPLASAKPTN